MRESAPGAWQRNIELRNDQIMAFHAVFSCITLIANDISKLRLKLVELQNGIWTEISSPAFSPVLNKPNRYQTRNQFWNSYYLSLLSHGNTYALKIRDGRGIVVELYVLDPTRVQPLISDNGDVYYRLSQDNISGLTGDVTVPAREIIHDRINCLFHPLVGISPLFANGLAAAQGLSIQKNSASFFGNNARPSGILTAAGHIDNETAERLKEHWEQNYTGEQGIGKVAVLGDGLSFQGMTMTAVDAQLIDQLKWSAEIVCSTFHVPPYKIGVGEMPKYDNIQSLNVEYYSQALQYLMEGTENCLDDGLGIGVSNPIAGRVIGTEFDVDGLTRMDSVTQMSVLEKASGIMTIDEKRKKLDLPARPDGAGDDVFLQQQNYSLAALAKRDAQSDPFGTTPALPAPVESDEPDDDLEPVEERAMRVARIADTLKQKANARDRRIV